MNSHYKIGMGALVLAIIAGLSGGMASLFYQINKSVSHWLVTPEVWANILQTHARMMVFFTLQPVLMIVFGVWFVPVLIGAKNFSFSLVNRVVLAFLYVGFGCNLATFFYPQATLLILGSLVFWAMASILFSVNMLVMLINNRAKGVNFLSLPVFVWMQGISAAILLGTASVLMAALTRDCWDYGSRIRWAVEQTVQNFSYPLVLLLVLPAFGVVFHIFQNMTRVLSLMSKRVVISLAVSVFSLFLFWNKVVFSGFFWDFNTTIKNMFVMALYLFVVGLSIYAVKPFFFDRKAMSVTPVLWAFGCIFLFVFAWPYKGLVSAVETIHSALTYAVLFSVFAGFYFWMGKVFGKQYVEYLGRLHFVVTLTGVLLTLKIISFGKETVFMADLVMGGSVLIFVGVLVTSCYVRTSLAANYWNRQAMTREWEQPSPMY